MAEQDLRTVQMLVHKMIEGRFHIQHLCPQYTLSGKSLRRIRTRQQSSHDRWRLRQSFEQNKRERSYQYHHRSNIVKGRLSWSETDQDN